MAEDLDEYERGKKQCENDITNGHPQLFWQTRGSWGEILTRLMLERFQVAVEHISDMTTIQLDSYREGYNEITVSYINHKYGLGAYQRVLDEVKQYRTEQYQQFLDSKGKA